MGDPATIEACDQRSMFLSFGKAGTRLETISPYPMFTRSQLDMRRKVEILKYKQKTVNSSASTKAKQWSQLVNLSKTNSNIANKVPCPYDALIPTSTAACDVPGKIMNLQYNPNIPLYKYDYQEQNYNLTNPTDKSVFEVSKNDDVDFNQDSYSIICIMALMNPIQHFYTYSLQIPISFYFTGKLDLNSANTKVSFINVTLDGATCQVYFNNKIVPNVNPTVNLSNVRNLKISLKRSINGYFEVTKYVGWVYVSNVVLPASAQYVYTFNMKFNISHTLIDNLNHEIQTTSNVREIYDLTVGNITGPTDNHYNQVNNCEIVESPAIPFHEFQLSGN
jgi:hypothetical protein